MGELEGEPQDAENVDELTATVLEVAMALERDRIRRPDRPRSIAEDLMLGSMQLGGAMPPVERFRYLITAGTSWDGVRISSWSAPTVIDVLKSTNWYRENAASGFLRGQAEDGSAPSSSPPRCPLPPGAHDDYSGGEEAWGGGGPDVLWSVAKRQPAIRELRHAFEEI